MSKEEQMETGVRMILDGLGIDYTKDQHFVGTPRRVAKSLLELCKGLDGTTPEDILSATFATTYDSLVLVDNIDFVGVCPHHLLVVHGIAHVGYVTQGKCVGLSKIPRLVKHLAARPIVQEDLTCEIAASLQRVLNPAGVMVVIEATHTCMSARGIKANGSTMKTSSVSGVFKDSVNARNEFFNLLSLRRR